MKRLTKSIVSTTALATAFFSGMPAYANSGPHIPLNAQAVDQLTQSAKHTLTVRDDLKAGNITAAKRTLEEALDGMSQALSKEPSLGLGNWDVKTLYQRLENIKAQMAAQNTANTNQALTQVLREAGFRGI